MKQLMIEGLPRVPGCTWQLSRNGTKLGATYWLSLVQDDKKVMTVQVVGGLADVVLVNAAKSIVERWEKTSRFRMFDDGPVELAAPHLTASRYKS